MNDKIQILIEAILSKTSEQELEKQLKKVEKKLKPVQVDVTTNSESQVKLFKSLQKIYKEEEKQRLIQEKASSKALADKERILQYEQKTRQAIEDSNKKEQIRTKALQEQIALFQKRMSLESNKITGKYDNLVDTTALGGLNSSIKDLTVDTPNVTNKMKTMALGMKEIETNAKNSGKAIKNTNQDSMSFGETLKRTVFKFSQWYLLGNVITSAFQAIKQGISYLIGLDSSLNEIRIVTGMTQQEVEKLGNSYNKLAKDMGIATREITSEAANLFRQGLDTSQVEERMKAIIKYAKISSLSLADSDKIITATANSTGESVNKIIDIFALLGDKTASGADEIGEALQKVASSAENSSVSIEKASSWISTISSKTRESSSVIGNSLKSLMARYESIKSTGFNSEDSTKLNDVVEMLAQLGIKATDTTGQLLPFAEMMDTVGKRYDNLTKNEKSYLTTVMGGVFQRNRLITLLSNYDDSLKNYEIALNSAGTAEQKFSIYQESANSKLDRFRSSWDGFIQSIMNSQAIKGTIDLGSKLIDTLGNLPTLIATIITSISLWKGTQLTTWIRTNKIATDGWRVALINNRGALIGMTEAEIASATATKGLTLTWNALKVAFMSNPIGLITTALLTAITAIDIFNQKSEEAKQKAEEKISKITEEASALNDLKTQYSEIIQSGDLTAESKSRLKDIQDQLIKTYGLEADAIDLVNGKYQDQIKIIDEAANKKYADLKRAMGGTAFEAQRSLTESNTTDLKVDSFSLINPNAYSFENLTSNSGLDKALSALQTKYADKFTFDDKSALTGNSAYKINGTLEERVKILGELSDAINDVAQKDSDYEGIANDISNQYSTLNDELTKNQEIWSKYAEADFYTKYKEQISEVHDLQVELTQEKDIGKKSALLVQLNSIKESITSSKGYITDYKTYVEGLFNTITDVTTEADDSAYNYSETLKTQNDKLNSFSESVSVYNEILSKLHGKQEITIDDILKWQKTFPQILNYMNIENGVIKVQEGAITKLIDAKKNEALVFENTEKQKLEVVKNAIVERLKYYGLESDVLAKSAEDVKKLTEQAYLAKANALGLNPNNPQQLGELKKLQDQVNGYRDTKDLIDKSIALITNGKFDTQVDKKTSSSTDKYKEAFNTQLNDLQYLRDKDKISEAEYYTRLEKLNTKFFANKKKYLEDYRQYEVEVYNGRIQLAEKSFDNELKSWETLFGNKTLGIDSYISKLQSKLKSKSLTTDQKEQLKNLLKDLQLEKVTDSIDKFNNSLDDSDRNLADLQHRYNMLGDDANQKAIVSNEILQEKEKQLASVNKRLLEYSDLISKATTTAEKEKYTVEVEKLVNKANTLEESIFTDVSNIRIESINNLKDAESKRHQQVLDNLDKELTTYQEFINSKIKALDDLYNKEDYESNISDQNEAILDKQNELNALALDTSTEAMAKKATIEEEINQLKSKKEDTQRDYTRNQEKDMYSDLLNAKEKDIKEQKELENDKFTNYSDTLDNMLDTTTTFHQQELDISKMTIDGIISYYENLNKTATGVYDNLIAKLTEAKNAGLGNPFSSDFSSQSSNDNTIPTVADAIQEATKIVEMHTFLEMNGHNVEWKNGKVVIDDKAVDMKNSGLDVVDGHWRGTVADIKKLLTKNGITFDQGGLAYGKGFMFKDTIRPEEILDPENTVTFRNLVEQLPDLKNMLTGVDGLLPIISNIKAFNSVSLEKQSNPITISKVETHVYAPEGIDTEKLANLASKKTFDSIRTKLATSSVTVK